jgi:hypothetical protein
MTWFFSMLKTIEVVAASFATIFAPLHPTSGLRFWLGNRTTYPIHPPRMLRLASKARIQGQRI